MELQILIPKSDLFTQKGQHLVEFVDLHGPGGAVEKSGTAQPRIQQVFDAPTVKRYVTHPQHSENLVRIM